MLVDRLDFSNEGADLQHIANIFCDKMDIWGGATEEKSALPWLLVILHEHYGTTLLVILQPSMIDSCRSLIRKSPLNKVITC